MIEEPPFATVAHSLGSILIPIGFEVTFGNHGWLTEES